ncbi:zinc finger MYM-type protein 1-like [Aphis craccivora]|uniref:Zinc finger MYM-type protein 1-like n=1 Tax=Aphis craccivora TaxID=307492 RepID=A0A6G0Z7J0_APHCR|nr:zinc finger MYM-type protein 1-like [Aphis craccivora]
MFPLTKVRRAKRLAYALVRPVGAKLVAEPGLGVPSFHLVLRILYWIKSNITDTQRYLVKMRYNYSEIHDFSNSERDGRNVRKLILHNTKATEKIPLHENSSIHKKNVCSWASLEMALNHCEGIDKELQNSIRKEEAMDESVFRGSNEIISSVGTSNQSGKFLNLINLDEFLEIITKKVKDEILSKIKEVKYYSILFDCTLDIGHQEQMTQGCHSSRFRRDTTGLVPTSPTPITAPVKLILIMEKLKKQASGYRSAIH